MIADNKTSHRVQFAAAVNVPELTRLVNKAYRGEASTKGWTSEAHLLNGSRIDEATMAEYIADKDTSILIYKNEAAEIKACAYLKREAGVLYLGMLSVDPNMQNSGIGKLLLKQAEEHATAHGYDMIEITVLDTRHELIAWYVRHGYKATGEIRPFPKETKFGEPKQPLQLMVMQKQVDTQQ